MLQSLNVQVLSGLFGAVPLFLKFRIAILNPEKYYTNYTGFRYNGQVIIYPDKSCSPVLWMETKNDAVGPRGPGSSNILHNHLETAFQTARFVNYVSIISLKLH